MNTANSGGDWRAPIEMELSRIEENAAYSGQSQFEAGKFWRAMNLVFGIPAAVLAAISGGTGLATAAGRVPAAIMALIAAGLGGLLTTINANRRATRCHSSANAYLGLEGDARILRTIDLPNMERDEGRAALEELVGRRNDINSTAEVPSFLAYWRGKRNIEKGRHANEVDEANV